MANSTNRAIIVDCRPLQAVRVSCGESIGRPRTGDNPPDCPLSLNALSTKKFISFLGNCGQVDAGIRKLCKINKCNNLQRSIGNGRYGFLCDKHHREKYPRNTDYYKRKSAIHKLRSYNITSDSFNKLKYSQNNCCAICGIKLEKVHIDHCHTTGNVRGLLCVKCNLGLGCFDDNLDLLASASSYLINSKIESDIA